MQNGPDVILTCVGDRVTTFTEEEQPGASGNTETEVNPATWRMLEVEFPQLPQPDGKMLVSRMLKPLSWITEHGVQEGLWILLGAEHGEAGKPGRVKQILPCPEVKSGKRHTQHPPPTDVAEAY